MKVAIIHYWLVGMRGGEKVIEALCEMYPQADIFTHVYVPEMVSDRIRQHRIIPTFINSLPRAARMYKTYLPLMPLALEQLDLRGYDLVISSKSGPAKGIIPPSGCASRLLLPYADALHLEHVSRLSAAAPASLTRLMMPPLSHYLRMWDVSSAARVDSFVANSATVARRIHRYYGADSVVIHPPVDTDAFSIAPPSETWRLLSDGGRTCVLQAAGSRRPSLQRNEAEARRDRRRRNARRDPPPCRPHGHGMGSQPFDVLKQHYARCRALIFPGEEDFGMVPVEAMASGRPVIAYGRGGATETVARDLTGVFFQKQTVEDISSAIRRLFEMEFDPDKILSHAKQFGRDRFFERMRAHIDGLLALKGGPH